MGGKILNRGVVSSVLALLAALCLADAARQGWGAVTIEGDRVKWGLRSMGRSPLQPTLVVEDFCRWADGARGLCALEPGSEWAAHVLRWASPLVWLAAAGLVASAGLLAWRRRAGRLALLCSGLFVAALGIAAILASHRISIFIRHAVDPGWGGSLTWRAALLLTGVALWVSAGRRHQTSGARSALGRE